MASYLRRPWLTLVLLALVALCWDRSNRLELAHESGLLSIHPPTPYIRYQGQEGRGRVLVVHGLDSSKEFMQIFSSALAEGGFDVYAIDLPGHGDSPVGFKATEAQLAVKNALSYLGGETIVVGHSLGAGLLLDLATEQRFETMVLLSPPPTPISTIEVGRLLVVTGDWDMPRINAFIPTLKELGSPNVEWWRLPWAAHSTAILNPSQINKIIAWLGGDTSHLRTWARVTWLAMLLASSAVLGIVLLPGSAITPRRAQFKNVLLLYATAGSATAVALKFALVMAWIRLFATGYLISFLLVFGLLLWLLWFRTTVAGTTTRWPSSRRFLSAGLAAAYVIVVIGLIGGSHLFHFQLSDGRWWRFPLIVAAGLPLFAVDEFVIRPLYPRWKAAALGILTRLLLGAIVATGTLLFSPQHAFLVLIIHLVVLFWMLLWFATELVHRYTQSPAAAALFAALVQGWAFASLFVTI